MADLEDLIRRVNRDMEEHRRQVEHRKQVEASQRAMAEQRRLIAEQAGWLQRYCLAPLGACRRGCDRGFVGSSAVFLTVPGH